MSFSDIALLGAGWQVFYAAIAFVLGSCLGSFMNCFAWRIVNGESILKGRSHCANCNHVLAPLDLVPIFSWLLLRGKCRYCGEHISARYMITELICGLFFLSIFIRFGLTAESLVFWVLGCVLLGLSLVDFDQMLIPNGFIVAGIVLWIVYALLRVLGFVPVPESNALFSFAFTENYALACILDELVAAFGIFIVMLLVVIVFGAVKGVSGMGMGDLKLYFMVSLYLGLACSLLNLIISCVIGLIIGSVYNSSGSNKELARSSVEPRESKPFPFGPSIALATWLTLLCGTDIVGAYLSLIGL